ncbi:response regulator transcription factor [Butyrivibrio sp. FC2001]|uniref:response regulator transcription factor n=1 Tax=Butyrivibrio sp. FC2001 TaxID=1280671 RepID=UPI00041B3E07|nr:response regulator transcription factor [Butyrivibrio sp. FC2001]
MIKILIADDQELMRQSLKMILGGVEDFEVTGAVSNGTDVIRSIRENKPDVILMDVRMPKMDGVVCTKIIKENEPDIKIIILTTFDDDEYVFNAIKNGASGYLLKGVSFEELIEAIRKVHSGMAIMNDDITNKVLKLFSEMAKSKDSVEVDEQSINEIKENEWAIIEGIVEGLSNKEIATKLNFSEGTIRNNLSNILNKLGLKNRTQLAIWAVQSDAMSRMNNKNNERN